jgi:hypothetical protein
MEVIADQVDPLLRRKRIFGLKNWIRNAAIAASFIGKYNSSNVTWLVTRMTISLGR